MLREQTDKSPEAFGFALREREPFVRWPSQAVDCATCRSSTAWEGHRTENLCVCSKDYSHVGVARAAGGSDAVRGLTKILGISRPRLLGFVFSAWLVSLLAGCRGDGTQTRRLDEEAGKTRFETYCAACHQLGGTGVEGRVPPLTGSPWVAGRESRLIRIVLHGLRGPIEINGQNYNMEMPGFYLFTDEEIASVLSYVRNRYGGPSPSITGATVSRVRAATRDHSGYWTVDKLREVP